MAMKSRDDSVGQVSGTRETQRAQETQGLFPMRIVCQKTGLAPATIRAWERRYNAVTPSRSEGKTRMFSSLEIHRLSLLAMATEAGHAIGAVSSLQNDELEALLNTTTPGDEDVEDYGGMHDSLITSEIVDAYLESIQRFEGFEAKALLSRSASFLSPRKVAMDVVAPILRRTGQMWANNKFCVAQEHLVSSHVKAVLSTLLHIMSSPGYAGRIITTTPPGHTHELGVLIGGIIAASHGFAVINLGPDLPYDEMMWVIETNHPSLLMMSVIRDFDDQEEAKFIADGTERLARQIPVWIGSPVNHQLRSLALSPRYFDDFQSLDQALGLMARAKA